MPAPETPGTPDEPPPRERANWILMGLIAAFGIVFFALTVLSGRGDSALLFVVLPCLLALLLAARPGRTTHGSVARATTIGLLLAAAAMHEGAICVLLAAPLVFAIAHGTTALVRMHQEDTRAYAVLPLPLLLLGGVEGVHEDWRVRPDQTVAVSRLVALAPDAVRERLLAGPQPVALRQVALRTLRAPVPVHVAGAGLEPGDRWMFGYPGSSHGTGGHIVTEVVEAAPGKVGFAVRQDHTITSRWLSWRGAEVRWRDVGDGRSEVTVELSYTRRLDPSWYFGPVQDRLMHAGAGHMLDMLGLP